ncbi:MAG: hypothetical protein WC239_11550, partial [Sphaerochaetaceae bacterium]
MHFCTLFFSFDCILKDFAVLYIWFYLEPYSVTGEAKPMAFIKVQKLVRNEEGNIISGSASIMT